MTHDELNSWPLWRLLDLGLTDLRRFEATPGNRVEMGTWLESSQDLCVGCMAGSIMSCEFGVRCVRGRLPLWMLAIDNVRHGFVSGAQHVLGISLDYQFDRNIPYYENDRDGFYAALEKLRDELREAGL